MCGDYRRINKFTKSNCYAMLIPKDNFEAIVATQDRVFPYYAPNSSIKHSKSDSKDRSQEIL
jgi:hypothetical protein